MQHALLTHRDVGGVGKVYESPQHLGTDVAQRDLGGRTLPEAAGEHGSEVRAAGGQHHLVHLRGDRSRSSVHPSSVRRHPGCDRGTSHLEVHRFVLVGDVQH